MPLNRTGINTFEIVLSLKLLTNLTNNFLIKSKVSLGSKNSDLINLIKATASKKSMVSRNCLSNLSLLKNIKLQSTNTINLLTAYKVEEKLRESIQKEFKLSIVDKTELVQES